MTVIPSSGDSNLKVVSSDTVNPFTVFIVSATEPTKRDNGGDLQQGDVWWNSTLEKSYYYVNSAWELSTGTASGVTPGDNVSVLNNDVPYLSGSSSIGLLGDVDIAGVVVNDTLKWDGFKFIPSAQGGSSNVGAINDLSDVTITSVSDGDILKYSSGAFVNTTLAAGDIPDLSGVYATATQGALATTALQPGTIGVSVQPYSNFTVIDTAYVHTDNNYTNAEKLKLASLSTNTGDDNVQSDYAETDTTVDSFIKNKPALGTAAFAATGDFATAAQGSKADSALQLNSIGVTVQGYNVNTVIDATYVATDNNFTTTLKNKLDAIADGAEVNVQSDFNATSGDALILNKPTQLSSFNNDVGFITDITGGTLQQLSDVTVTDLAVGDIINWNGTAWVNNSAPPADISGSSIGSLNDVDTTTTAPTNGQALIWSQAEGEWYPGDILAVSDVTSVNGETGAVVLNADEIAAGVTNKYTTQAEITKLAGIAIGAEVNVKSNYTETDPTSDAFIRNKPTLGSAAATDSGDYATAAQGVKADSALQSGANVSELVNDAGYVTAASAGGVTSVNGKAGIVTLDSSDVGLANVDNTSDAAKPVSTAQQTALDAKADLVGGTVPESQLPSGVKTHYLGAVDTEAAMLALTGEKGDWCVRNDKFTSYVIVGADPSVVAGWKSVTNGGTTVVSVNGDIGVVSVTPANIGAATTAQGSLADTSLQPSDIGASVQGYDANIVVDASYTHTDNNFTTSEKTKLGGIATGAEVNVQADFTESDVSSDAFILNKPTLGTAAATAATDYATSAQGTKADSAVQPSDNISTLTNDSGFISDITSETIGDLSDVTLTSTSNGDILSYNGAVWVNTAAPPADISGSSVGQLADVDTSTTLPITGQALVWNGTDGEWQPGDVASDAPVDSVNGKTGTVVLDSDDIDDSSSTNKYVTAAQKLSIGTAVQPSDNISTLTNDANFITASGAPVQTVNGASGTVVLDSDDIDDTGKTHKFVTSAQVSLINTAIQPGGNVSDFTNDANYLVNINSLSIDELSDVDTTTASPATGQALIWNNTNWVPTTVVSDLQDLTDVTISSISTGDIISWNGSAWVNGSAPPADISGSSINALNDVDTSTNPPSDGQVLAWSASGGKWVASAAGQEPPVDSVNGAIGTVVLTTSDIAEGTNLYSQWATSGSNISYSGGAVGIGTSTLSYDLEIANATGGNLRIAASGGNANLRLQSSNNGLARVFFGDTADSNRGYIAYNNLDESLKFNVNASEALRIDSGGNVGIGVSDNSDYKLQVNGNTDVVGNITVSGSVDGRDLAVDGAKLDDIANNANYVTTTSQLTNDSNFITAAGAPVQTVNGANGTVVLDPDDLDDTESTHKFVTEAQRSAIDTATQPGDNISTLTNNVGYLTSSGIPVQSVNGSTGAVVLDADDINDASTTHKFATAAQLTKADSATQPGDNVSTLNNDAGYITAAQADVQSVNTQTGAVVLDADDIDDTSTTHKFATAAQLTSIGTALQPGAIGVSVQGYDVNTVIDSAYVHTDNNFTTTEKNKLGGVATGAEVNVQADFTETDTAVDSFIKNKPTKLSEFTNDSGFVTSSGNTTIGTDDDYTGTGANVLSGLTLTDGVITAFANRNLTLADLGFTGDADANKITDNSQILNGAGYITSANGGNAGSLGGATASQYLRSDNADRKTSGTLGFDDNVILAFGSSDDAELFCDGAHVYLDLNAEIGNFYIRDGETTKFTFDDNGDFTATGNVTATGFAGDGSSLTSLNASNLGSGTISDSRLPSSISADTTGTANNATNVDVLADNTTDAEHYVTFVDGASGSQRPTSDTALTFNPFSNTLTSTNFSGALSGNASTATSAAALTTARTIELTGDVTGSTSFDGSGNVSITAVIIDDSHSHVISNVDGLQSALDGKQASGTYNTIIGSDDNIAYTGATVVSTVEMTDGVITDHTSRTLTLADLGYTGATDANKITDNNQIANGAGYITGSADITGNANTATTAANVTVTDESSDGECYLLFSTGATSTQSIHSNAANLAFNSTNGTLVSTNFSGGGSGLSNLNASNITSGTIGDAYLPATISSDVTGSSASCTGNAATATTASACSGNSATATTAAACSGNSATATDATNSANVLVDAANSVDSSHFVMFTSGGSGNQRLNSDNTLVYNPNTNTLTTGTVSATLSGAGGSITGINASNISTGTLGSDRLSGTYTIDIDGNATTSSSCSGNAATATTAASCSGNAATSSSCTGNAATSSSCTGNAASATTAGNADKLDNLEANQFLRRDQGDTMSGNLSVTGSITATGDVTAYSDISLKENIRPLENSLEKVNKLRGVQYDRIDINSKDEIGVIAQEIEEIYPEFVHEGEEGIKSVDYSKMVSVLIEAVKELTEKVNRLENK